MPRPSALPVSSLVSYASPLLACPSELAELESETLINTRVEVMANALLDVFGEKVAKVESQTITTH